MITGDTQASLAGGQRRPRSIAAVSEPLPPLRDSGVTHRIVVGPAPGTNLSALPPFVGLADDVIPAHAGFGMHPHRGIEIVTYLWQGGLRHQDSLGNDSVLLAGGAERILSGRGISHAELPTGPEDTLGLQLWLGLSEADRHLAPEFQDLPPSTLPVVEFDGGRLRVIAGAVAGRESPLRTRTPMLYLDISLAPGRELRQPVPADYAGLLYVLAGRGRFGEPAADAGPHQRLVLGPGDEVRAAADSAGELRFILLAGRPVTG